LDRAANLGRNDLKGAARASAKRVTLIIPVYNEGANFSTLWAQVTSRIEIPFSAIVVYDFDQDDTVPVVSKIIKEGEARLRLLKNKRRGVVGAITTGFKEVHDGPVVVLMADLSDDLSTIAPMFRLYCEGFDLVAASRYSPGGDIIGGPWLKKNLSRMAGLSLAFLRGIPTRDATNAFKMYDAAMLRNISVESESGFEINLELTIKAFLMGYRIAETPTVWRDREAGKSNFKLWNWMPSYLRWYFFAFRPKQRAQSKTEG
jgi:dolichol-phosphate mannosyltransferase